MQTLLEIEQCFGFLSNTIRPAHQTVFHPLYILPCRRRISHNVNYTDVKYSAFLNKTHIIKVQPKNQLCLNFFTTLSSFYSESCLQTTLHTPKG